MKKEVDYDTRLEDIKPGEVFTMLNYDKLYIRIEADRGYTVRHEHTFNREWHELGTDGFHVAIVELNTGRFFYMSKQKPCKIMFG